MSALATLGHAGRWKAASVWIAAGVVAAGLAAGCGGSGSDEGSRQVGGPDATSPGAAGNADATMDDDAGDASHGDDVSPWSGGDAPVGDDEDCCTACFGTNRADLDLSCAPAAVTSAVLTGSCAPSPAADASASLGTGFSCDPPLSTTTPFADCSEVSFDTSTPGDCHVALTFANGSSYAADVQITSMPQTCCGCPGLALTPSPAVLVVKVGDAACGAGYAGGE
jgi:hypothetical protein